MRNYIIRRLLIMIPILFGITLVNFFLINLAPGNHLDFMISPTMTPEVREILERNLGFDAPIHRRYITWLGNLLQGNVGYSYNSYRPVADIITERIPATLLLMCSALLAGLAIAIPLGAVSAIKQHSFLDYFITLIAFFGVSAPNFFLGLGMIYVFSIQLKLFPSSGMYTVGMEGDILDILRHLILPCAVLSINICGRFMRYVRSSMLEVLQQDYMRTAKAKGVPFFSRLSVHAFRNALLPLITLVGLEIPNLLGGAVITEQIFSWPGIGRLTIDSIMTRDYPVLMGLNLMAAVLVLSASLIADCVYALADPRIKYS